MRKLLLCLGLLAAFDAAAAGVYKWVDRTGATRFDDHSLLAERLTRASIARGAVAADAKATVPAELVAEVAQQCRDFKERRASYAEARAVFGRDPVGNQYQFSPYQVALEVARLGEETRRFCRPLAAQYLIAEARTALRQQAETLKSAEKSPSSSSSRDRMGCQWRRRG